MIELDVLITHIRHTSRQLEKLATAFVDPVFMFSVVEQLDSISDQLEDFGSES